MHVQDEARSWDTILSLLRFTTTLHCVRSHCVSSRFAANAAHQVSPSRVRFRRRFSFPFFFFSSSPKGKGEREKSRKTRPRGRGQSSPDLGPQLRSYHRKIHRTLITLSTLETDYRLIIVARSNKYELQIRSAVAVRFFRRVQTRRLTLRKK